MNRQGQPRKCGITGPHTNLAGLMLCKCCLEILNNNLISEFVFYKCSPIWDNGTMEHALGVVASAHLRPSPPLLDSPVLDMPLLPGSCPHSPFPLTLWLLLVTLPCGPGPSAGECWKAGPNLPGLQSFKSSPKSRFCEWILLIFFFFFFFTVDSLIKKSKHVSLLFPR